MRLWHQALIPHLPRQQLLGQHRECCALRGLGWGKPHATVNYVFDHPRGPFLKEDNTMKHYPVWYVNHLGEKHKITVMAHSAKEAIELFNDSRKLLKVRQVIAIGPGKIS